MAREIYEFPVTIPAGTPQAAPQKTDLTMPTRVVDTIEVLVPPGPRGEVGFQLASKGVAFIPRNTQNYIVTDDERIEWPVEGMMDSGAWQLIAYNTGQFAHTVYVRFLVQVSGQTASGAPPGAAGGPLDLGGTSGGVGLPPAPTLPPVSLPPAPTIPPISLPPAPQLPGLSQPGSTTATAPHRVILEDSPMLIRVTPDIATPDKPFPIPDLYDSGDPNTPFVTWVGITSVEGATVSYGIWDQSGKTAWWLSQDATLNPPVPGQSGPNTLAFNAKRDANFTGSYTFGLVIRTGGACVVGYHFQ